ncbi:TPA: phage virion morphogenesis protein [Campylobacter jejuni]|nr:phage virion morphogenesis protein [Campylobacter jejuni]HDZ4943855.1 phage virion morphogenesis protein [Campylobacter jejuni]HDZ4954530.1 phage virion morphogenesis protein [Campylobacter jejuni]HDZ4971954.1 phage virion morphogenesis protein [Campylobacter jejuni]HDZ5037813.1 phage virion morphogenesis protein [Campylobacter jejuni]
MMIEIKGLENFFKACDNLIDMNKHGQSILTSAGESIRNGIEISFERESSLFGEKWKPLKNSTLTYKKKKGFSERILHKSGNLSSNWMIEATNNKVEVFNNTQSKNGFKYGLIHQYGSKKKNIPARPFLPIDNNNVLHKGIRSVIYEDTKDFIVRIVKK